MDGRNLVGDGVLMSFCGGALKKLIYGNVASAISTLGYSEQ